MASARKTLGVVSSGVVRVRSGRGVSATRAFHASTKTLADAGAGAGTVASGPPFKKFFWITTGIMFGIPGALGAAFVYNLKTDDEFYEHFSEKYPELVATVNEYVPLNEPSKYADREDVGEVAPISELLHQTVTIVAELRSGMKVRFQAQGSASQAEIEALAVQHSGDAHDRVIAIEFVEEESESSEAPQVSVQAATGPSQTITTAAAWPPAPRTMWTGKPKPRVDVVTDARKEIDAIRAQQLALEESKYAGRDIDEADEEIRVLEERKIELKMLLPRKRFLWIF